MRTGIGLTSGRPGDWRENGIFLLQTFTIPLSGGSTDTINITIDRPELNRGDMVVYVNALQFATLAVGATGGGNGFLQCEFSDDALSTIHTGTVRYTGLARTATATGLILLAEVASATLGFSGLILNGAGTGLISHSATMAQEHLTGITLFLTDNFATADSNKRVEFRYQSVNSASNHYWCEGIGTVPNIAQINGLRIETVGGVPVTFTKGVVEVWGTKGRNPVRI